MATTLNGSVDWNGLFRADVLRVIDAGFSYVCRMPRYPMMQPVYHVTRNLVHHLPKFAH